MALPGHSSPAATVPWYGIARALLDGKVEVDGSFDKGYIKSVNCFDKHGHFNNINSSNKRVWDIFSFLYHLQFLSSMFYSFCSIDLSSPWLSLFQGIF